MASATVRTLLGGLIDYAGLFPPTALPLADVVRNYAGYRESADRWALGHLVIPATSLAELVELVPDGVRPWRINALVGDDITADAACILAARSTSRVYIDTAEVRASTCEAVEAAVHALARVRTVYVEIPVSADPSSLVRAVANAGVRAKIRTGGITAEMFPAASECAQFIASCWKYHVSFKATAGLHHPVAGTYDLTYENEAPRGGMFGFLNLFLAAAFTSKGVSPHELEAVLTETDPRRFHFDDDGVSWREHTLSFDDIQAMRESFGMSFGSCSFREPIDDLHALGLL